MFGRRARSTGRFPKRMAQSESGPDSHSDDAPSDPRNETGVGGDHPDRRSGADRGFMPLPERDGRVHPLELDYRSRLASRRTALRSGLSFASSRTDPPAARRMTLNMGPQHPSTHGVLRIVVELEGETIKRAEPDIGFLHTGIEKQCEAINWQQVVTLTDRVDYLSTLANNLVYALTVEKLLQLEIPPRAQCMRVMLCEIDRLNSHLVWLGTHALDIGAMSMFFYCFREREDVLRLKEMFSGQRMMTSYIRPGGVALEPPRGWEKAMGKFIKQFPSKVDEYENLLDSNPIWKIRTQGVGYISIEDMLDLGITGPMLRAAGIPLDVRKTEPYSSYEKFDFVVPTYTENDVYARYRVRLEEMRHTARIVVQALE